VMVGMQAALQVVLQRFKPEILEKRLGQSALLEKLPLYRQAKTWDLFTELYSEIANEAEDDFHQLFGRTFSKAYEEQIRRLESLKHADPNLKTF
ncbi:MAG: type VI secretion system-associated FHA domain protein, partial [Candidatus Thiodiazotropha sp. 6PLUC9]